MKMDGIPFGTTDWSTIEKIEHPGATGASYSRTLQLGAIRVRVVVLEPGMSYHVSDAAAPHRFFTAVGAKLLTRRTSALPRHGCRAANEATPKRRLPSSALGEHLDSRARMSAYRP